MLTPSNGVALSLMRFKRCMCSPAPRPPCCHFFWIFKSAPHYIFTRVGTFVQRGSKFCFVVALLGVRGIAQNIALLSNFTMHSAALPGSLTRQPCPAARPISTVFDAHARLLRSHRTVLVAGQQTACARCCPDRFKLVFSPISPCFHYVSPNCMRALLYWQV
jgi:hypothetical protein